MAEQTAVSTPVETPPPSTPVETPSPSDRLQRMTPEEHTAWRNTGAIPGVSETPAIPAPEADEGDAAPDASEGDVAPPTDPTPPTAAAASDAGKTLAKRKQTAQERINELARKNYLLEGELAGLRSAQSSRPAAAAEPQPAPSAPSPLPPGFQFPDWEQWSVANPGQSYESYNFAGTAALIAFDRQQSAAAAHDQHIASAFYARIEAFKAVHPDYLDVVSNPQVVALAHPYLHQAIRESEHGPAVAYYLSTHLEELRTLASQPTAAAFDRAFGKLEARLEAASTPPAASTTNHITQAPAPPPTLGSRPVVPGDDIEAAVRRKDPGEYMRAMNARELASRGK